MSDSPDLSVEIAGLRLRAPVLLAAGTAGTIDEAGDVVRLDQIGGVVTKSITQDPRDGNAAWRILGLESGMINAIGLANPGVEAFVRDHAPAAAGMPCAVVASVAGFSIDQYVRVAGDLAACEGVDAIELNVSCPNVDHAGHSREFGADPALLRELVRAVRPVVNCPLLVKLGPVTIGTPATIVDLCRAAIDAGATPNGPGQRPGVDAVSLCNTVPGMAIDVENRRPLIANVTGGLSGPMVHHAVVKIVHDAYRGVCRDSETPIVAIGGVLRWHHAAEFVLAGASAVQMGTATFVDPKSPERVVKGLRAWARRQGAASVRELVGGVSLG